MNEYRYGAPADEQPLEHLVSDGGYASIFRTVAFVGDSLASGEFQTAAPDGTYAFYDMFEYSWGQYLARMAGFTAHSFSRGGMTAEEYCEHFAKKKGYWDTSLKAQAYVIALGVNDMKRVNTPAEMGDLSDIDPEDPKNNKPTFLGYYARIIQQYKAIAPDAKFFLVTAPKMLPEVPWRDPVKLDRQRELMYALAEYFPNIYVIDLRQYAPAHDAEFQQRFYLHGHMNAMGYRLTAEQVGSYIDYLIRHNWKDFYNVPFINTDIPTYGLTSV